MASKEASSYIVESWPSWAQREFWIQFWLRALLTTVTTPIQKFRGKEDRDWAEPIYDRTYSRVKSAQE